MFISVIIWEWQVIFTKDMYISWTKDMNERLGYLLKQTTNSKCIFMDNINAENYYTFLENTMLKLDSYWRRSFNFLKINDLSQIKDYKWWSNGIKSNERFKDNILGSAKISSMNKKWQEDPSSTYSRCPHLSWRHSWMQSSGKRVHIRLVPLQWWWLPSMQ